MLCVCVHRKPAVTLKILAHFYLNDHCPQKPTWNTFRSNLLDCMGFVVACELHLHVCESPLVACVFVYMYGTISARSRCHNPLAAML